MTIPILPQDFVEKYKLIPKNLRVKFLDFLGTISDTITAYDEMDILEDAFFQLRLYEQEHPEIDNYLSLMWMLIDEVYAGEHKVYMDIITSFYRCLSWLKKPVELEDVVKFHRKLVMRDINERVSYLPGNPGYERTREHFMMLSNSSV
jgi:hypothetical protein